MKKFLLILFAFLLLFSGCDSTETAQPTQTVNEYQVRRELDKDNLLNFAKENNINDAIILVDFDYYYSIELQDLMPGKYLAFYALVIDIFRKNDKTYLFLEDDYNNFYYRVECSNEIANTLRYYEYEYKSLAVIVKAESVSKNSYEVAAEKEDEYYDLYVDTSSMYEICGECINIKIFENE